MNREKSVPNPATEKAPSMVGGRKFDVRNPAATVGEVLRGLLRPSSACGRWKRRLRRRRRRGPRPGSPPQRGEKGADCSAPLSVDPRPRAAHLSVFVFRCELGAANTRDLTSRISDIEFASDRHSMTDKFFFSRFDNPPGPSMVGRAANSTSEIPLPPFVRSCVVCCTQLSMWSVETKTDRAPKKTRPETEGSTASGERKGRLFCPAAVSAVASALVGPAIFQVIPPSVETCTAPSVKVL